MADGEGTGEVEAWGRAREGGRDATNRSRRYLPTLPFHRTSVALRVCLVYEAEHGNLAAQFETLPAHPSKTGGRTFESTNSIEGCQPELGPHTQGGELLVELPYFRQNLVLEPGLVSILRLEDGCTYALYLGDIYTTVTGCSRARACQHTHTSVHARTCTRKHMHAHARARTPHAHTRTRAHARRQAPAVYMRWR